MKLFNQSQLPITPAPKNFHPNDNHLFLKEKSTAQNKDRILPVAIQIGMDNRLRILYTKTQDPHQISDRDRCTGRRLILSFPIQGDSRSGFWSLEDRPCGLEAGNNQHFSSSIAFLK